MKRHGGNIRGMCTFLAFILQFSIFRLFSVIDHEGGITVFLVLHAPDSGWGRSEDKGETCSPPPLGSSCLVSDRRPVGAWSSGEKKRRRSVAHPNPALDPRLSFCLTCTRVPFICLRNVHLAGVTLSPASPPPCCQPVGTQPGLQPSSALEDRGSGRSIQ